MAEDEKPKDERETDDKDRAKGERQDKSWPPKTMEQKVPNARGQK